MRYAAPVAMPAGLGEWLGAELEARGVEAASLYARAVLSILLHSEVAEAEAELDHPERDPNAWNPRAALELELRLERHTKETRRGRPSIKKNYAAKSSSSSNGGHHPKRSSNMATPNGRNNASVTPVRRRPHSWNGGDEEALKKCAAIECLLSATDDGQWGPVEKLVDELCSRLKLLQLEQQACCGDGRAAKHRRMATSGSAPERAADSGAAIPFASDSDSFTSVSSPEGDPENYRQAFPPLEYLSDSDQGTSTHPVTEPIWNVRKNADASKKRQEQEEQQQQSRVRFVRMTGTRLSPPPPMSSAFPSQSYGDSCPSEAYFGDCSRDSSLERTPAIGQPSAMAKTLTAVNTTSTATTATTTVAGKGRLYERGAEHVGGWVGEPALVNDVLDNAFKSFCQFNRDSPLFEPKVEPVERSLACDDRAVKWSPSDWKTMTSSGADGSNSGSNGNIWAPLESDWALLGPESLLAPWPTAPLTAKMPTDTAVQLSLALLNHHPERSGFSPVLAKSLMLQTAHGPLPKSSKLMEWLVNLAATGSEQQQQQQEQQHRHQQQLEKQLDMVDCDEEEVQSILKKETSSAEQQEQQQQLQEQEQRQQQQQKQQVAEEEDEEQENLLTSPKTHFCPIQQEGDAEVEVRDGATFDVNAQPGEVHFLRSPSGALYLPDCQENGDGWKGWAKYMVYKTPPSPSPFLALEAAAATGAATTSVAATDPPPFGHQLQQSHSRATTPFTLKFRVVQTEKCCQTDARLSIDPEKLSARPLAISSPFTATSFSSGPEVSVLGAGDVWKFDARAVTLELMDDLIEDKGRHQQQPQEVKQAQIREVDGKEEELDGLLSEVWSAAAALNDGDEDVNDDIVDIMEDGVVTAEAPELVEPAVPLGFARLATVADVSVADADVAAAAEMAAPVVAGLVRPEAEEYDLDELWNPFMDEAGDEEVDVCEWVPQAYRHAGADDGGGGQWTEEDTLVVADSWPPPNIPVEYLDDDFFEEIYGSLDSMKASETASNGGGGGTSKNSRRRRRRSSKNQAPARRPKRPCSFFVEGECRRPDCKFSHDLGSITCRFWIESSCFKGDECPFLHGIAAKEVDRNRSCSDAELSESYGSAEEGHTPRSVRERGGKAAKKFQFDLEADFPSLSQAPSKLLAAGAANGRTGPIISQSRPIAITQGFATADQTGSSLENNGQGDNGGASGGAALKRRRKRFSSQRAGGLNLVETSSETSPVETSAVAVNMAAGKRSRKVAKMHTLCPPTIVVSCGGKSGKGFGNSKRAADVTPLPSERRRTKSEHDSHPSSSVGAEGGAGVGGPTRSRLSSSYKEG